MLKKRNRGESPAQPLPAEDPVLGMDEFSKLPEELAMPEETAEEAPVFYEPELPPEPEQPKKGKNRRGSKKKEPRQKKPRSKAQGAKGSGTLAAAMDSLKRLVRYLVLVLGCYLFQVCVMPYLQVWDVTPNIMITMIAVVTVTHGMLRAYWTGAIYGILLETMLPAIRFITLLMYPVTAMFFSVFFADKSEKRLEAERAMNRPARNGNAYLRTVACALCLTFTYEAVNLTYITLGGTALNMGHLMRSGINLLLTPAMTAVLMVPFRRFLGFRYAPKEEKQARGRYLNRRPGL